MKKCSVLRKDLFWVISSQVVSAIIMLASMKIWTVYLEPAELGLMALIIGTASILVGIGLQPLFQAMLVGYPIHAHEGSGASFRAILGAMVRRRVIGFAGLIIITGVPLAWFFELHWATPFGVVILFVIDALRLFEQMLFAAARRQRNTAFISVGDLAFRLAGVWFFLSMLDATGYNAVAGNIVGALLFVIIIRLMLRLEAFPAANNVGRELAQAIRANVQRIARPLLPSMVLANLTEMGNRYFIAAILGLSSAGLFVISYGFVKRPYGMLNHVGEMVMTPVLRTAISEGKSEVIGRARKRWFIFIAVFSVLGAVFIYLLREPLVMLFFSEKYLAAADLLFPIAIAVALFNLANVFNWFSLTLMDGRAVLINNIVGALTTMVMTIILGLYLGLSGVVLALIVGYGLQFIASIIMFSISTKRYVEELEVVAKPADEKTKEISNTIGSQTRTTL